MGDQKTTIVNQSNPKRVKKTYLSTSCQGLASSPSM